MEEGRALARAWNVHYIEASAMDFEVNKECRMFIFWILFNRLWKKCSKNVFSRWITLIRQTMNFKKLQPKHVQMKPALLYRLPYHLGMVSIGSRTGIQQEKIDQNLHVLFAKRNRFRFIDVNRFVSLYIIF